MSVLDKRWYSYSTRESHILDRICHETSRSTTSTVTNQVFEICRRKSCMSYIVNSPKQVPPNQKLSIPPILNIYFIFSLRRTSFLTTSMVYFSHHQQDITNFLSCRGGLEVEHVDREVFSLLWWIESRLRMEFIMSVKIFRNKGSNAIVF